MARSESRLRDWIFSGPGKHRLLEVLLLDEPDRRWTRTQLAVAAGQHRKAKIELYLRPLIQAELLVVRSGRYQVDRDHPLAEPLAAVLRELRALPDEALRR